MTAPAPLAGRALAGAALLAVLVTGAAALQWSGRHPLGTSWDESFYVNMVVQSVRDAHDHGIVSTAKAMRWSDRERPPAYRLVALPVAYLLGSDPRTLRALSLLALLATGGMVYGAARLFAGAPLAVAAAAATVLSFSALWASAHFGTEYVLYAAVAGVLWGLAFGALRPAEPAGVGLWVGLAAATSLGVLSKASFLLFAVPAVLTFLVLGWRMGLAARTLWVVATACAAGALTGVPWWVMNFGAAARYARYASAYGYGVPWIPEAFWRLLGPPLIALGIVIAVVAGLRRHRLRKAMSPPLVIVLAVCAAGAVPLFLSHLLGTNHLMRLVSPALIPAWLGIAVLAAGSGALDTSVQAAVAGLALLLQGVYLTHHFATTNFSQWEWEPLRIACEARGLPDPTVRYLGLGISLTPPAIAYPWVLRGREVNVARLWRYEFGAIDWGRVDAQVDSADVVLTAPDFTGDSGDPADQEALDNGHNGELVRRLESQPRFDAPVELRLGKERTRILVFFKKRPGAASPAVTP